MRPALLIARRDFVELVRTGRLYWSAGLMLLLLLTALAVGWQRQAESQSERVRAQALDYDDWLGQPERHPHDAAHQGLHVFRPEPTLSIVDPGIGPYVGSTLWLRAHRQTEVKFRPAQDATGLQRFGSLSAAWILQVLAPLLVIVLGFAAISGEREQGTLRQLLSLGVTPGQLLLGKVLALLGALAVVLLPAAALASGIVLLAAAPDERVDAALRLAALAVAYGLYLGSFVLVVHGVSARASSSRLSLVWLLGLWIVSTLMAPRLVADVSRNLVPSASRRDFEHQLDEALGSATQRAWLAQFGKGTPFGPEVSLSQWGLGLRVHDHAGYAVLDQHFDRLWDSYARQQRVQEWAGLLIPTVAVRAFSMGVVGSDFAEHRAFSTAAERHRRAMQDVISEDLIEHADGHGEQHFTYRAERSLWAKVPAFAYRPAAALDSIVRSLRSFGTLAAAWALAGWFAIAAVSRRRLGV